METMNKFWNVKTDGSKSHIDLFGYVGGSKEWNFGFNEEDFLKEIREIPEDNALEISINSFGGSVYTALSIYSLLKAHKGEITFRVDGAAMSAATIITSVPNAKVIMPQGAMMMIHKVSSWIEGNTDDFRKAADEMEQLENNILNIYAEKTGKTVDEIKPFVDDTTYFTADQAVEFGLADETDDSKTVKNYQSGDKVMVNGLAVSAKFFERAPKGFINKADAQPAPAIQTQATKERKTMTLEELKAEHSELMEAYRKEAYENGVKEERARIQAIEEIADAGHEELVQSAKFEKPISAEQLAVAILKADKAKNAAMLKNVLADGQDVANAAGTAGNTGVEPSNAKPAAKKTREEQIAEQKALFAEAKNL